MVVGVSREVFCELTLPNIHRPYGIYWNINSATVAQKQSQICKWVGIAVNKTLFTRAGCEQDLDLSPPCSSDGKEPARNAGDPASIPGSGRFPGEGKGNPLQCSCLENAMDSPWSCKESDTTEQLSLIHPACQCRRHKKHVFDPWVRKIPWRRKWQTTPVFLPGESHG